jgi:hypothetical protein
MPDRSALQKKKTTEKAQSGVHNNPQANHHDANTLRRLGQTGSQLPAQDMLHLQRTVGNQALSSSLKSGGGVAQPNFLSAEPHVQRALGSGLKKGDEVYKFVPAPTKFFPLKVFSVLARTGQITLQDPTTNNIYKVMPDSPEYTTTKDEQAWLAWKKTADTAERNSMVTTNDSGDTVIDAEKAWEYCANRAGSKANYFHWVVYFGEQASDQAAMKKEVAKLFTLIPGAGVGAAPTVDLMTDNAEIRKILTNILKMGFASFYDIENMVQPAEKLSPETSVAGTSYAIGYRSDNRTPSELGLSKPSPPKPGEKAPDEVAPEGFTPKIEAKSEGYRKSLGLDQEWHPFNAAYLDQLPGTRGAKGEDASYFRQGIKDNDLYTVISVGTDWQSCVRFPYIGDYNDQATEATTPQGGKTYTLNTYLYIMLVEKGFATSKQQTNAFAEIATRSVPPENILAMVPIARHYAGNTSDFNVKFTFETLPAITLGLGKAKYLDVNPAVQSALDTQLSNIQNKRGEAVESSDKLKFF